MKNPEANRVRADGAFEAIIDLETFCKARDIIAARSGRLSDEAMLDKLATVLAHHGYLTGLIIDESDDCPSSSSYAGRFGTLLRAYALVRFIPDHDYRYLEINRALRRLFPDVLATIVAGVQSAGGTVFRHSGTDLLTINSEFTASILISRCFQTSAGTPADAKRLSASMQWPLARAFRSLPNGRSSSSEDRNDPDRAGGCR